MVCERIALSCASMGGSGTGIGMFDDGTRISPLPPDTFYSEFIWLRWTDWDGVSFKDRILVKGIHSTLTNPIGPDTGSPTCSRWNRTSSSSSPGGVSEHLSGCRRAHGAGDDAVPVEAQWSE